MMALRFLAKFREIPLGLLFVLFAVLSFGREPAIENVFFTDADWRSEPVSLPFERSGLTRFSVEFDVNSLGKPFSLRLIPDDCAYDVIVNGKNLELGGKRGLCDFQDGFVLTPRDLEPVLQDLNHFSVRIRNRGGPAGLDAKVLGGSRFGNAAGLLAALLFCALLFSLLRRTRFPGWAAALVALATLLHVLYAFDTPWQSRAHDVGGHVAYVKHIVRTGTIPDAGACWTCYHPPLYYLANAPVHAAGQALFGQPERAMQWFSVLLSCLTLALGVAVLLKTMRGAPLAVACLLWCLWPVLFLVAPRIGNDQLFYVAHLGALLGCVAWLRDRNARGLFLAAVCCWFAWWTKSTAAVTIALWWTALGISAVRRLAEGPAAEPAAPGDAKWFNPAIVAGCGLPLAIGLLRLFGGGDLVGNSDGLADELAVKSGLQNLLWFDLREFLTTTWTSPWTDAGGRQFLPTYMAKTALFGEFDLLNTPLGNACATLMCFSFVGLAAFAVRGFVRRRLGATELLLVAQGVLFYGAMAALRAKYPFACSSDFRYAVPMLLSFVPFVAWGMEKEDAGAKWRLLRAAVLLFFVGPTLVLCLSL